MVLVLLAAAEDGALGLPAAGTDGRTAGPGDAGVGRGLRPAGTGGLSSPMPMLAVLRELVFGHV